MHLAQISAGGPLAPDERLVLPPTSLEQTTHSYQGSSRSDAAPAVRATSRTCPSRGPLRRSASRVFKKVFQIGSQPRLIVFGDDQVITMEFAYSPTERGALVCMASTVRMRPVTRAGRSLGLSALISLCFSRTWQCRRTS